MGNAKIWYWPQGGSAIHEIDLGEGLTDMQVTPAHDGTRRRSLAGATYTHTRARLYRVRFELERFTSWPLWAKLRNLEDHLNRGGWCGVAIDADKAWAAFLSGALYPGRLSLPHGGNNWGHNTSGTVADGDYVAIDTFGPAGKSEIVTVASVSTLRLVVDSPGLLMPFSEDVVLARHEGYYPYMCAPAGSGAVSILSDNHRQTFSLSMELVEDLRMLAGAHTTRGGQPNVEPTGNTSPFGEDTSNTWSSKK